MINLFVDGINRNIFNQEQLKKKLKKKCYYTIFFSFYFKHLDGDIEKKKFLNQTIFFSF